MGDNGDIAIAQNMVDVVNGMHNKNIGAIDFPKSDVIRIESDTNIEPHDGIQFESHETAYSFYQEYAKSMGFATSIKNSRRSKKSKEFIDAKFACSRYGFTPESDSGNSRRSNLKKTDCKASMHVKRKSDGKWVIYSFIKEHNHELLPALSYHFRIHKNVKLAEKNNIDILHAVSERTRKMYVEMSRQKGGLYNVGYQQNEICHDRGRHLALEAGDSQVLLEYFKHIKKENSDFFYAIDLNEEQRLRNLFWVDGKCRNDYASFDDVVSFDSSFIKSNDNKMPFAPFIGVNHHFQPMLLGYALVADESVSTFVWLMKTWLRAMGGKAPKVIITDQDEALKVAIKEVFPKSRHCFSLWHVFEKIPDILAPVIQKHGKFMAKFNKCIFKSWNEEQFDLRWWKMVSRFELHNYKWVQTLYDDREKWVPTYMNDTFLAGMSTIQRSDWINSFLEKYIHKKISLKEFIKQYGTILQNRYEEEAMADFDTWHKQPALKSPSPWEKQVSTVYTHAIFKKFQVEVLGVVGCHFKKESEDGTTVTFKVQDCEKNEDFIVAWNEKDSEVSCLCRSFEYKGYLCRHAMIVLQICGLTSIPSYYILKRWTKDAKNKQLIIEESKQAQTRVRRYNDLCREAIELSEEGSLSQESYNIVLRDLGEALKKCVNVNDLNNSVTECSRISLGIHDEEENHSGTLASKTSRKKYTTKKRKVQSELDVMADEAPERMHHMEHISSDVMNLGGYYGSQQNVQGLVQLNLMEPPHDAYYVNQQSMSGLGQLNSIASGHENYYGTQQSMHGLVHMDFRTPPTFSYSLQEDVNLRTSQMHDNASRHP